jgi:hypothetical protein
VGPQAVVSVQVLSRPFRLGNDRNTPVGRPKHSLDWGRASRALRRLRTLLGLTRFGLKASLTIAIAELDPLAEKIPGAGSSL